MVKGHPKETHEAQVERTSKENLQGTKGDTKHESVHMYKKTKRLFILCSLAQLQEI